MYHMNVRVEMLGHHNPIATDSKIVDKSIGYTPWIAAFILSSSLVIMRKVDENRAKRF